jgi:hypothetical protein
MPCNRVRQEDAVELKMRFQAYASDSLDVIKANPLPTLVAGVLLAVPIFNILALTNYLRGVKASKAEGTSIEIGALFDLENASNKLIALIAVAVLAILSSVTIVGPLLVSAAFAFTPCLLADRPGLSWSAALQGSLSFALKNPLDMLVLVVIAGVIAFVGGLCVVGFLITGPLAAGMTWMAYQANQTSVEATSAARGVMLS